MGVYFADTGSAPYLSGGLRWCSVGVRGIALAGRSRVQPTHYQQVCGCCVLVEKVQTISLPAPAALREGLNTFPIAASRAEFQGESQAAEADPIPFAWDQNRMICGWRTRPNTSHWQVLWGQQISDALDHFVGARA